jgi:hypothetical protein
MQWSKLRTRVRALICPELRRRIDFHVTAYRKAPWHDPDWTESDLGIVSIDGERVFVCNYIRNAQKVCFWMTPLDKFDWRNGPPQGSRREFAELHSPQQMGDALRAYLNMPVTMALKSNDPFIRALVIVDRRTGRRTLQEMQIGGADHTLVKTFYKLRMATLE